MGDEELSAGEEISPRVGGLGTWWPWSLWADLTNMPPTEPRYKTVIKNWQDGVGIKVFAARPDYSGLLCRAQGGLP